MTAAPIRAFRTLRGNWKVTVVAVLSLGVAMALGVAALSVSNTFLVLPLAGTNPNRLVTINERTRGSDSLEISYPDYQYFRANNHVFAGIAAAPNSVSVNFSSDSSGHQIHTISRPLSGNYFSVLGLQPYLGRLLVDGDDHANPPVAVMTYGSWKRNGSDRAIIGKNIAGHIIVGVAPKEFTGSLYGTNGDLMLSLAPDETSTKREERHLILIGRLKPGVTRQQAQTEMQALAGQLATAFPKEDKDRTVEVSRATLLPPDAVPAAQLIGAILMGLVLLVLVIACANVANLLLAVAVGRRREAAIKMALGAQRGRLIRDFLLESALLCAGGGLLGYLIASAAVARFTDFSIRLPLYGTYSFGLNLHMGWTVAAGTGVLVLIAALATGLVPALYASSPHLSQMLAGEVVVGGTRKNARRNALVIIQIAVCTFVLVGMGLAERNLYNLRHVDLGFSERNIVAEALFLGQEGFGKEKLAGKLDEVRRAATAIPGVDSVTLASGLPLFDDSETAVRGSASDKPVQMGHVVVDNDYFPTLRFHRLAGRTFDASDREKGPEVAVINHKLAQMFFPGRDPVGETLLVDEPPRRVTIAGVVADGKYSDVDEETKPYFYLSLAQHPPESVNVIVRTKGDPERWEEPLAKAMRNIGFNAPIQPASLNEWMDVILFGQRIAAMVVAVLGGLGLALAIVGLAAAISYSVSERRKELGIRVAMGAGHWQLLRMILRQTGAVSSIGIVAGIVLGVGATILLKSQLYGIGAVEWTVLIPVGLGVLAVSLAVAYFSARPWINVDPMEAVRHT